MPLFDGEHPMPNNNKDNENQDVEEEAADTERDPECPQFFEPESSTA